MASITLGFSAPKPWIFMSSSSSSSYHKQSPTTLFSKSPLSSSIFPFNTLTASSFSPSFPSHTLSTSRWRPSSATAESLEPDTESAVDSETDLESTQFVETDGEQEEATESVESAEKSEIPKGANAFAVVMVCRETGFFSFASFSAFLGFYLLLVRVCLWGAFFRGK